MKHHSVLIMMAVVTFGAVGLRGQDPDEGAGRGRPLAAYRPSVPGVHGLVTAGHPLAAIAARSSIHASFSKPSRTSTSPAPRSL